MMPRRIVLLALVLITAALAAPTGADAARAVATGSHGAAATVDPDATRVAIEVLRAGGNAVDAAIAANATLGVTEPYVAGIGGGGFMTIYRARDHRVVTIDGRETAPQSFPQDAFIDPSTGKPIPFTPQRVTSGMAVGVPGTLATWAKADRRYGTMPLARLLQPAIRVARRGFVVDQTFDAQTEQNLARLDAFTSSRSYYLGHDRQAPTVGSRLRNPDLAKAYTLIARDGPKAFYDGPIGAAVVDTVQHPPVAEDSNLGFDVRPGLMTTDDMRSYLAVQRLPTHVNYRGLDVYGMGPPSSGGTTVGEALNILSGFRMSTPDRPLALHRYLEASRLAYADRNRWVGDPDKVQVPVDRLLSPEFAAERRCLIGPKAAKSPVPAGDPFAPFGAGCSGDAGASARGDEGTSTNHLTVVDSQGNVVSYTSTIEQTAGSAIAVPGWGFLLNNELTDFDAAPPSDGTPDPNLAAGGKRPRSSMAPTIVLRHGRPAFAVGSPGGATIITTVLQTLVNHIDFRRSLPLAIAAPRASQQNSAQTQAEPAFISQYGGPLKRRFDQDLVVPPPPAPTSEIGAATGIEFLRGGRLQAATEPVRRGGGVAATVCTAGSHRGYWTTIGRRARTRAC
jgi:gamma-glutamyltranspeptidase/glutathione hydrolase